MNRKFLLVGILAIAISSFISSCRKQTVNNDTVQTKAYFPLDLGKYVEYRVDSTIWSSFDCSVRQTTWLLRYTVADTFSDDSMHRSYRIEIRQRKADSSSWQTQGNILVTPTETSIEYTQSNLKFIKLIFPVVDGLYWNGNSYIPTADQDYNYFADWTYSYANVGQPYNTGLANFDNCVTVNQADKSLNTTDGPGSYSYRTYAKEVYAKNVGMVYRELTHWVQQPDSSGVNTCREGYSVIMRASDHN